MCAGRDSGKFKKFMIDSRFNERWINDIRRLIKDLMWSADDINRLVNDTNQITSDRISVFFEASCAHFCGALWRLAYHLLLLPSSTLLCSLSPYPPLPQQTRVFLILLMYFPAVAYLNHYQTPPPPYVRIPSRYNCSATDAKPLGSLQLQGSQGRDVAGSLLTAGPPHSHSSPTVIQNDFICFPSPYLAKCSSCFHCRGHIGCSCTLASLLKCSGFRAPIIHSKLRVPTAAWVSTLVCSRISILLRAL